METQNKTQEEFDNELYLAHKALVQFASNKKVKIGGASMASELLADKYNISKSKVLASIRRVRDARRKKICNLYSVQEKTVTEIAREMECNPALVLRILREERIHNGKVARKKHIYTKPEFKEFLSDAISSGATINQIACNSDLSKLQVLEAILFHFNVKGIERAREIINKEESK